jgi:mono/diheme cytochrome c family protein
MMKRGFRIAGIMILAGSFVNAGAQQPVAGVYKANCAPCHGATGDASTPAGKNFKVPSFSADAVLKQSDTELLTVARNGKGKMPAWHDKLSEDQLKDLIAFIHTLQKKS